MKYIVEISLWENTYGQVLYVLLMIQSADQHTNIPYIWYGKLIPFKGLNGYTMIF